MDGVQLSGQYPHVYVGIPDIDATALTKFANNPHDSYLGNLLPPNAVVLDTEITAQIRNPQDLSNLVRLVFRLNQTTHADNQSMQYRIAKAFETLQIVSDLPERFHEIQVRRESHLDRAGVDFRIGQVVQHKTFRWRAVVVAWERIVSMPKGKLTSLTTKDYASKRKTSSLDEQREPILYKVLLDSRDSRMSETDDGPQLRLQNVYQADLNLVEDGRLCRIHSSHTAHFFVHFDVRSNSYVPNEALATEYPLDRRWQTPEKDEKLAEDQMFSEMINSIQRIAARLTCIIEKETERNEISVEIMHPLKQHLTRILSGFSSRSRTWISLDPTNRDVSPQLLAMRYLAEYEEFTRKLENVLQQRRAGAKLIDRAKFRTGEIVENKSSKLRGVIVGWNPSYVSDNFLNVLKGSHQVENSDQKPSYSIIVVPDDEMSGSGIPPIPVYESEDYLRKYNGDCALRADFLGFEWQKDDNNGIYIAPAFTSFIFGENGEGHEIAEKCCLGLLRELNVLNLVQQGNEYSCEDEIQKIGTTFSVNILFQCLMLVAHARDANAIMKSLDNVWRGSLYFEHRLHLIDGVHLFDRGLVSKALAVFQKVVSEDPKNGAAWSMISFCQLNLNEHEASVNAANCALELIPQDYRVMGIWGFTHLGMGQHELGAEALDKCLSINPWFHAPTHVVNTYGAVKRPAELDERQHEGV